jgi:hypothetical protein
MLLLSRPQIGTRSRSIQRVIPFTLIGKADDKLAVRAPPAPPDMTPLNDHAFDGQSFNMQFRTAMASSAIDIDTLPQHAANIRFFDAEVDRRWSTRADEPGKHSPLPNGIPIRIGAGARRCSTRQTRTPTAPLRRL